MIVINLIQPPQHLLDLLVNQGERPAHLSFDMPSYNPNTADVAKWDATIKLVIDCCMDFFRGRWRGCSKKAARELIGQVFWEALTNAIEHGNGCDENKKVAFGLWLGSHGVILGTKDEGDFFQDEVMIELIQSRSCLDSTRAEPGGCGLSIIYLAQHIAVCDNTLYVMLTWPQLRNAQKILTA